MKNVTPHRHRQGSPLVAGIILILLGGLLLALNLGLGFPLSLWEYWPFLLIVPGVVGTAMCDGYGTADSSSRMVIGPVLQ